MATSLFGTALRKLRREKKVNLAQLADAIGVSITYVSDIERGKKNPPKRKAISSWMEVLGCQERLEEFMSLAYRSVNNLTVSTEGKSERETLVLASLARQFDDGGFSKEELDVLEQLLIRRKENDANN